MVQHPARYFLPVALLGGAALILGAVVRDVKTLQRYAVDLPWMQLTWTQLSLWLYWVAGASVLALVVMWVWYAIGKRRQGG